ncbi:MAG: 30S ribosomal protein S10 [Halobacteriaceae archaeon]
MTVRTKLTLESGDRAALDGVVESVKTTARRKGADFRGPFDDPPETHAVPLYRSVGSGDDVWDTWEYTVYRRRIEVDGHDEIAQTVLERSFPDSVRVSIEVEQTGANRP